MRHISFWSARSSSMLPTKSFWVRTGRSFWSPRAKRTRSGIRAQSRLGSWSCTPRPWTAISRTWSSFGRRPSRRTARRSSPSCGTTAWSRRDPVIGLWGLDECRSLAFAAASQISVGLVTGHRSREEIALKVSASQGGQRIALFELLHPFGCGLQVERVSQLHDGIDETPPLVVVHEVVNKAFVDLEDVDRKLCQRRE